MRTRRRPEDFHKTNRAPLHGGKVATYSRLCKIPHLPCFHSAPKRYFFKKKVHVFKRPNGTRFHLLFSFFEKITFSFPLPYFSIMEHSSRHSLICRRCCRCRQQTTNNYSSASISAEWVKAFETASTMWTSIGARVTHHRQFRVVRLVNIHGQVTVTTAAYIQIGFWKSVYDQK